MQQKLNTKKLYEMYERHLEFEKYEFENYVQNNYYISNNNVDYWEDDYNVVFKEEITKEYILNFVFEQFKNEVINKMNFLNDHFISRRSYKNELNHKLSIYKYLVKVINEDIFEDIIRNEIKYAISAVQEDDQADAQTKAPSNTAGQGR